MRFGKYKRNARGAASISEFGAVVVIIVLCIVVPTINIFLASLAAVLLAINADQTLIAASESPTYDQAHKALIEHAKSINTSRWANLLRLKLAARSDRIGMDLYVQATDPQRGTVVLSKANSPLLPMTRSPGLIFQYILKTDFSVEPLITTSLPCIRDIPFIGKPWSISLTTTRMVEHEDFSFTGNSEFIN